MPAPEPLLSSRADVADDVFRLRIAVWCGSVGLVLGVVIGVAFGGGLLAGVGGAVVGTAAGLFVYRYVVTAAAEAIGGLLVPDRRTPELRYSHIEAMEARGDIDGALRAWESAILEHPGAVASRLHCADLHARKGNNPARAAALFREVQRLPAAGDDAHRYASQRLVDLLLGPLQDEGAALVELRKIADKWPGLREGAGARDAIARIKAARRAADGG